MKTEVHDLRTGHTKHARIFRSAAFFALLQCRMQRWDADIRRPARECFDGAIDNIEVQAKLDKNVEEPGALVTEDTRRNG